MSSEASIRDRAIRDHQAWLGYLQPDGLVVSPAALVDAQVVLDTRAIDTQAKFEPFVETVDDEANDRQNKVIADFPAFCRGFLEWPDDLLFGPPSADPARPLPESLTIPLPELGETLEPTYALKDPRPREPKPGESPQPWLLLVKILPTGSDLDIVTTGDSASWSASATRRFERLLRETRVPIGLLVSGTHLRLLYAPRGENSGSLTFPVAAMTEVAGRPILAALHTLLSAYRLLAAPTEARLPALLQRSRDYQSTVSTELAQQVIDAAFDLLRGFQAADERTKGDLLRDILTAAPNKVYEGLLTVLMRCVFLLFAEDRSLMPGGSLYQQNYSLHGLFERLRADHERYPDTMDSRYGAWAQLLALFRAVYSGCSHPSLKLPARAGYLFDPDRFPFLEGPPPATASTRRMLPLVPDGTVFRCLRRLLILKGERLSYRTLDVEQIGSVYEVMMGFGVGIAKGPSIAIKPKKTHGAPVPINLEELLAQPPADRAKWLKAATDQELTGDAAAALKSARTVDDLLAALERRVARSATPSPVPKGAMLLVPSDERRRSGSNYTPRSLTEPIVRKTLEPILKRLAMPGRDGVASSPTPEQILDLKVCDPAMGSGAFLVEACRQLAEELVRAWHAHGKLPQEIPPDEDELLYARRLIAQRCLYGVDKNPMAADLAKLSMWLATLARDHPFTFLDHSFRAGDSLVGLTRKQIASFTWEPEGGLQKQIWSTLIEPRIDEALRARQEILNAGDFLNPAIKRQKLEVADDRLGLVRFIGDLAVAAFFAGEKDKQRKEKRAEYLQALTAYLGDRSKLGSGGAAGDITKRPQKPVDALKAGEKGVTPFHWEIEFPEVFGRSGPGFDAMVGNPPFMWGNRISSEFGEGYRDWLLECHSGSHGNSDLVAHFFRSACTLLQQGGAFGFLATNSISEADTRQTGLDYLLHNGACIYHAVRDFRWTGSASVRVALVCVCKQAVSGMAELDGEMVASIGSDLRPGSLSLQAQALRANARRCFKGVDFGGTGFLLARDERDALLSQFPKEASYIWPVLNAEDITSMAVIEPERWIINFTDLTLEEAERAPGCMARVRELVLPHRERQKRDANREYWWIYNEARPGLYSSIAGLPRVLANPVVSKYVSFTFLKPRTVFTNALNVFSWSTWQPFAVLQSRIHDLWALQHASTLRTDPRYNATDCFETFPFPEGFETDLRLEAAGKEYYEFRAALMVKNNEGLTKTYNRFHDPDETSPDILQLRTLHAAMDRAVLDAYGWTDIPTHCEFLLDYEEEEDDSAPDTGKGRKKRKPYRYRWPDPIRDEVLARLLALNAERAEEERLTGTAAAASTRSPKGKAKKAAKPGASTDGGLFGTSSNRAKE